MSRVRTSLGPSNAKMDAALIRNLKRLAKARAGEIARLTAEVAELLGMNSDRNDLEQDRDECRNAMNYYAVETKRLTAENEALRAVVAEARAALKRIDNDAMAYALSIGDAKRVRAVLAHIAALSAQQGEDK